MDLSLDSNKKMKLDEPVPPPKSPLDKPMWQLTEEDISQLTREDCRRFLRDKGMRRPSWNKSQAIEQVISLKTLLEPGKPDSDTNVAPRLRLSLSRPRPDHSAQIPSRGKEKVGDVQILGSGTATANVNVGHMLVAVPDPVCATNTNANRDMNLTNEMVGQMTIFYCGKVNVYNGILASKALAVMQLAASPNVPQDSQPAKTAAAQSFACPSQASSIGLGLGFPYVVSPTHNVGAESFQQYQEEVTPSREPEPEGSMSRKASVQRYLEKRKDRGKFKIKRKIESPSGLEVYLNQQQQLRDHIPDEQSSQSRGCTPPLPRPPQTPSRCNSVVLSIDLNANDISAAREA